MNRSFSKTLSLALAGMLCSTATFAVVRAICGGKKLNDLTPEEDFVLGSMLGYDIRKQCERYMKKRSARSKEAVIHKCA